MNSISLRNQYVGFPCPDEAGLTRETQRRTQLQMIIVLMLWFFYTKLAVPVHFSTWTLISPGAVCEIFGRENVWLMCLWRFTFIQATV